MLVNEDCFGQWMSSSSGDYNRVFVGCSFLKVHSVGHFIIDALDMRNHPLFTSELQNIVKFTDFQAVQLSPIFWLQMRLRIVTFQQGSS